MKERIELPKEWKNLTVLHDLYSGKTIDVRDGAVTLELRSGEGVILQ